MKIPKNIELIIKPLPGYINTSGSNDSICTVALVKLLKMLSVLMVVCNLIIFGHNQEAQLL